MVLTKEWRSSLRISLEGHQEDYSRIMFSHLDDVSLSQINRHSTLLATDTSHITVNENYHKKSGEIVDALTGSVVHFSTSANCNDAGLGGTASFATTLEQFEDAMKSDEVLTIVAGSCLPDGSGPGDDFVKDCSKFMRGLARGSRVLKTSKALLEWSKPVSIRFSLRISADYSMSF